MAEEKKKKEPKKKKKERMDINLPNARRSMSRNREMKQLRTNYEDAWKFAATALVVLFVIFVLMGGINQGAAWRALVELARNIGETIISWFDGTQITSNENGIYIVP